MKELIQYIDPATALAVVVFLYNLLKPLVRSIYLNKKEENVLLAAKRAVTYSAQQSNLDNNQRRALAEKLIAEWLVSHNLPMSKDSILTYLEYAYQLLKNNKDIDIKSINGGKK